MSNKSGNFGLASRTFYDINKDKKKTINQDISSIASTEDIDAGFLSSTLFGNKKSTSPHFRNINLLQKHQSVKKAVQERSLQPDEKYNIFSPFETFHSSQTRPS